MHRTHKMAAALAALTLAVLPLASASAHPGFGLIHPWGVARGVVGVVAAIVTLPLAIAAAVLEPGAFEGPAPGGPGYYAPGPGYYGPPAYYAPRAYYAPPRPYYAPGPGYGRGYGRDYGPAHGSPHGYYGGAAHYSGSYGAPNSAHSHGDGYRR